jgi:hypothetical protein
MAKQRVLSHLAICVKTDDPDLLTPRMIYEILPDEPAAKSNYVRAIDNEGEDYLYPAEYFVFVRFPQEVERTLLRVSPAMAQGSSGRRTQRVALLVKGKSNETRATKRLKRTA